MAFNLHILMAESCLYTGFTGRSMILRLSTRAIWVVLVLAFGFCGAAKADNCVPAANQPCVSVDGTYSFADYSTGSGYGIPPYGGTLSFNNGVSQSEQFYCVDFRDEITGGMSWNVTVTSLSSGSSGFGSTLLALSNPTWTGTQVQSAYLEMAWLVTQMMSASGDSAKAAYQYAIWSLTGGPYVSTNAALLKEAAAAIGTFNAQGWEILTPVGCTLTSCPGQEFLVYASEPSILTLLFVGLLALALVAHKRLGA
jgi:hypothetical protein